MTIRLDKTGFGDIEIFQNTDQFCYGVDAVLLADFAANKARKIGEKCNIIDLGTGTGIVPLILSHKCNANTIWGVEVQKDSYELGIENVNHNSLNHRINLLNCNVKDIDFKSLEGKFSIVTSNPPYMKAESGIKNHNNAKTIARHEALGSLDDFVKASAILLKDKGELFMVHRPSRLIDIIITLKKYKMEPKELTFVSGKPMEKPNILLLRAVKNGGSELKINKPISVHKEDGSYSEEILEIYERN